MKKYFFLLFLLCFFCQPVQFDEGFVLQDNCIQNVSLLSSEIEQEFEENINDQLEDLDFSDIEELVDNLDENQENIFGNKTFFEKIKIILSGDFIGDFDNVWELVVSFLFDNLLSVLPFVATIIAISILGGLIGSLKPNTNSKSIGNVVHFIIYGLILILLSSIILKMIDLTSSTLMSIKSQVDIIFPILLTTLTAVGGTVSATLFQPAVALLSGFIITIFTSFLMPIFLVELVLNMVSSLSSSVKLDKLSSFLRSLFKWTVGIVFTIFSSFMAIQGLTAGSVDGLSIRTAKFTIKNSVPMVGSYLSDGLFLIMASSNLIKNAVGSAGFLLLIATVLSPLIQLIIFMLSLKFMAGIIQPLGDGKIAGFVSSLAKSMTMLIVMILCVSFMYIILTGLVMCSANIL